MENSEVNNMIDINEMRTNTREKIKPKEDDGTVIEKIATVENFDLDKFTIGLAASDNENVPDIAIGFINEDGTKWTDYVTMTMHVLEAVRDFLGWGMIDAGETRRELCWKRKGDETHPEQEIVLALEIREPQVGVIN